MVFDNDSNKPAQDLLNNVLRNINEDLSSLRSDFKKLNDLVIVLSVKIEETKSIKSEIKELFVKIDSIYLKIFELEKAKERLELIIAQVDKDRKSADQIAELQINNKIGNIDSKIQDFSWKQPIIIKALIAFAVILALILYVTKSYNDVFEFIKILL